MRCLDVDEFPFGVERMNNTNTFRVQPWDFVAPLELVLVLFLG